MSKILLNPGPTNTRLVTKIKQWEGTDYCHREDDFLALLNALQLKLRKEVYSHSTAKTAIIAGSGTTAMQSMISSLVNDDIVVINAGKYGLRAIEMMKTFNIKYIEKKSSTIDDLIPSNKTMNIYFVENETSTGEKYSIEKMCEIYPNAMFYIDATASYGASTYLEYSDKIIALCFCSNKCLQSVPGLGIVVWNGKSSLYKRDYFTYLGNYGHNKLPFTLPTQSVFALQESIKYSLNNEACFDNRRDKLIEQFEKIGISCINKHPCNSIVCFQHPVKNYNSLKNFLYKRGIVIYSGVDDVENSFRVSTMSTLFEKKFNIILEAFRDSCIC